MKKAYFKSHGEVFADMERRTLEDFRSRRPLEDDELQLYSILKSTVGESKDEVIIPVLTKEQADLMGEVNDGAGLEIDDTEFFKNSRDYMIKELERHMNYLRPGRKYALLAHNPARVRQGRRFAYIGVDGDIHIGRKGKSLKVAMMAA